jgi:uncharacterized delta-60 repeat protein/uncharacterized repeat protein (TIGR01451 family)
MQNEMYLRRGVRAFAPVWLLAAFLGLLPDTRAQNNPPPNDNLANAQPISGLTGTVTGNNLLATTQVGEPTPVSGVLSGASIWYLWTAPMTRFMDFDTHNSTDPYGNTLDTVMAVYSLPLGSSTPVLANLTAVTNNDDDPNANSWPLVSRVNFLAFAGTTYAIQLEGKIVGGVTNEGYIVLNWAPAVAAGIVSFSTNLYNFGEADNYLLYDELIEYSFNSELDELGQSLMNTNVLNQATNIGSTAATGQGRVTLVRTGGYTGRMQVDISLTADTYSNYYATNGWISTIYIGPSDANGNPIAGPDTNITISTTNMYFTLGYDVTGITEFLNFTNSTQSILSNTLDATGYATTFYTNIPDCGNYNGPPKRTGQLPVTIVTNNTTVGTNTTTNYVVFSTNITLIPMTDLGFLTPSAVDGTDFYSTDYQTVTFDDFQMSKDAFVNICPLYGDLTGAEGSGGPDYPDVYGNDVYPGIPRRVILTLSNPRLDPLESLDVAAPTLAGNAVVPDGYGALGGGGFLATNTSVAEMTIQDIYNPPPVTHQGPCTTPNVYNFERRTFRTPKPPLYSTNTPVTLFVYRFGQTKTATSVNFTVNAEKNNEWGKPASLEAGSDYAIGQLNGNTVALGNYDYTIPYASSTGNGTVSFGANQANDTPSTLSIIDNNNGAVEFDMEYEVELTGTGVGNIGVANVTEMFDQNRLDINGNITHQQPGGAADRNWNPELLPYSIPPYTTRPGADNEVEAIAVQPDGKAIVGGHFRQYDNADFPFLVRTLTNGFPDLSFNPGSGPNDFVAAAAIDTNTGKILLGGNFTSFNGVLANHVVRLNPDGSLDSTFNTGLGANNTVWAVAIDPVGNVIIGGDFTAFNSTNRYHVARLIGGNGAAAGSLDVSFDTGSTPQLGTDLDVRAVAADSFGNVVLGGPFQYVNGTNWPGLARLTPRGALDTSFNPGTGVNGPVYSLAVQSPGNQIVIGGDFSQVNLTNLSCIARLNFNGTVDYSFSPGVGVNGPVYAVAIQPDQKILLGGQFTSVGTVRRMGYARMLTNGWVDTSFMDTSYNQFAGLINHYYNQYAVNTNDLPYPAQYNTPKYVKAMAVQPNGNVMIGGNFIRVGGGYYRDDVNVRWNVASIIGAPTLGPQGANGGIGNYPGNVGFTQSIYSAGDTSGDRFITVSRVNGSLAPVNIVLGSNTPPPGPGAASSADFGLVNYGVALYPRTGSEYINGYGWRNEDSEYGPNYQTSFDGEDIPIDVSIFDNPAAQQNLYANLSFLSVNDLDTFNLGGMPIPTYPAPATTLTTLEIIDDHFTPGTLGFSATNYNVVESGGSITITVLRTNGNTGSVSVNYKTQNGFTNDPNVQTAVAGVDYTSSTGTLSFADGVLSASFQVPIINHSTLQSNKFFNVILSTPTGGASFDTNSPPILVTNAIVTIVDNHFQPGHLSFTGTSYSVTKGGTATVSIARSGGALGTVSVACLTQNGTGVSGVNYTSVSNWLVWNDSDVSVKTVSIPTLEDNVVEGTKTFNVILTNAIVANNGSGAPTNSLVLLYPTNAVVSIADDDFYGQLNFSPTNVNVLQNGGSVTVTVSRSGGTVGTISVNFSTANGAGLLAPFLPALAGTNYGATNGTLVFGPGVTSQSFSIPIYYTPAETNAANRIINVTLSNPNPPAITNGSPFPKTGTITILDNQLVTGAPGSVDTTTLSGNGFNNVVDSLCMQPDGSVLAAGLFTFVNQYPFNRLTRLHPDGSVDPTFLAQMAGSDGEIQVVLSQTPAAGQTNGSIMVAGSFAHFNTVPRNNIARVNLDGSLDGFFNPGAGADGAIYALVQTMLAPAATNQAPILAYLIGGAFANFNGIPRSGVARLTSAGLVDPNFNPGNGVTSTNGVVHALALQADGRVIVGGDFTTFNNFTYHHLVRLNLDGSIDPTFNADTGPSVDGSVHAILIQPNGQILIGGVFTNVNGVNLNHIARLNPDGSLDATFNVGVGANSTVESIALDSQGRILLGGNFSTASGVTRNAMTRLNADGTVDPTINFGAGANGYVRAIAVQANDEINVGGSFSSFGGYLQNNFTRLFGGEIFGPGTFQFVQAVFGVVEDQTNAIVTIQRIGGTGGATFPTVSALFTTADGSALNGVDYLGVSNTVSFPTGETFTNILVPVINNGVVGSNKFFNVNLSKPIAAALGLQSAAEVIITNANSALEFSAQNYRQSENIAGGAAVIPIVRIGSPYNTVTVTVSTGTNGTATPGADYLPATQTMVFYPGVMTNLFLVPLLNNINMLSDRTVDMELSNPVGGFLAAPSQALLTIATVYAGPGVVSFDQPSYTISEGVPTALITIIRTNGVTGPISVNLATSNGTAVAGVNYQGINQVVNFSDGQSSQTISIPIIQQTNVTVDTTVFLILSSPVGTSISGSNVETLTIQNDIQNFTMTAPDYFVSEGAGSVTVSIMRNGPTNGTASVGYITVSPTNAYGTNGYAIPGLNYGPTNGTLTFAPGQTFQTIPIAIYQQNTVDGPETFQVFLTNASAGTQISTPGSALVTIIGDVTGFELATNSYVTGENGSNVVVTVNRLNVNTGAVSVNYSTSNASAVAGVDYVATNGILDFADGQASTNILLTILNPNILESNKTFIFALSNPRSTISTNCYLLSPSNAVITITNTITAISFSSPVYTVSECGVQAQITVLRSGVSNTTASIQFATADGTGRAGTNYFATNGLLTFEPGVTSTNFAVSVIDDHIITADHTVVLSLMNPQGGAVLGSPSISILTIQECDGAYIIAAGTLLTSESFKPTNGLIDPGETVTVLFALRDIAGGNTTNLVATLQTNSGVSPVLPNSQNYGALVEGGHVVFEPFSFTATGTNNQVISTVFRLQDGTRNLATVAFSFTLGTSVATFSAPGVIVITNLPGYANNPTPASPYPSSINVTGIASAVVKATVTISNLYHQLPSDIEMVVITPFTNVLLMNDVGGGNGQGVTNFTFTFDDAASNYLSSNQLPNGVSVTNKPTPYIDEYVNVNGSYTNVTLFLGNNWGLLPVMPFPVPASPYATNLSVLSGAPANGPWALYVADTKILDYGAINGGWSVNLSTGNPVPAYTDLELTVVPSPSAATVSNLLLYTVALTNYGPAGATGVVITNLLPPGLAYLSNNFAGAVFTNSGVLAFSNYSLAVGAGFSFNVAFIPAAATTLTNTFIATDGELESSTNNVTNIVTTVSVPSADLGVAIAGAPNPVLAGSSVIFTVTVTNNGPSIASATTVTNYLPAGLVLTASSASIGTVAGSGGTNVWNVGSLAPNASATLSLTTLATASSGATVLDTVVVASSVFDPFKLNNFASFKIVINPAPMLSFGSGVNGYTMTWPASATNFVLKGATNLNPPVVWVTVTNPAPAIVNGQYSIPLPVDGFHFFILTTP